jgi:PadR family transcriptional regulator AphA
VKLEIPLLGLLAAQPMTGYDLQRWTRVEGKFIGLDRHPSQIYRELSRLETEGWLTHVVDPRENAPDAKIYSVTGTGVDRVLRWLHSTYVPPRRFEDPEFKFRLRIAAMFDLERAMDLIQQELDARREQVRENRGRERDADHLTAAHCGVDAHALSLVADAENRYGEASIDHWIEWLEEMRSSIEELRSSRRSRAATSTSSAPDREAGV